MWRKTSAFSAFCLLVAAPFARAQAVPANARVERDVVFARAGEVELKLDIYTPANAQSPAPVILRISPHREQPARPASDLLARGCVLIYAGYQVDNPDPKHQFEKFPADLHAAKAAVRWVHGNAQARGFDDDRLAIWGTENGATIAALLANTADQKDLNGTLGEFASASNAVRAVCLFGGTTDWRNAELYGDESVNLPTSAAYQLFGANPKDLSDEARRASAVNYIRPSSPACLMVTLASDSNRAMHLIYAETLRRAGVPSALYEEPPGSGAGLGGRAVDEAKLDRTILLFFDDTLAKKSAPAMPDWNSEVRQLSAGGLYKQARRLVEEQMANLPANGRASHLQMLQQISQDQQAPAIAQLQAAKKSFGSGSPGLPVFWTIREVLTDPDRIGNYHVERGIPQKVYDLRADAMRLVETLNGQIHRMEWELADRQAMLMREVAVHGDADSATLNEFLSRYEKIRRNPGQLAPPGVRTPAYATAYGQDVYGYWFELKIANSVQRFRYVPPGNFTMGSSRDEWGRLPAEALLEPGKIVNGFWIADAEVTQGLYEGVMGKAANHSYFQPRSEAQQNLPAERVSYADAINFLNKLRISARLPSSEEFEYACRAGSNYMYAGTGRLADIAWFWDEAPSLRDPNSPDNVRILHELETEKTQNSRTTHPVKQKLPNAWGLYDMQGNVWEWCSGSSPDKTPDLHIARGGSWISIPQSCRAARVAWFSTEEEAWNLGLRIAIPVEKY